jgi:hypothetical protein
VHHINWFVEVLRLEVMSQHGLRSFNHVGESAANLTYANNQNFALLQGSSSRVDVTRSRPANSTDVMLRHR